LRGASKYILLLSFAIILLFLNRLFFSSIREIRFPPFMTNMINSLAVASILAILSLVICLSKITDKRNILLSALSSWLIISILPPLVFRLFVLLSPSGSAIPPNLIGYAILLQPYLAYFLSGFLGSLILIYANLSNRWIYGGLLGFLSFIYFSLSDYIHIFEDKLDFISLTIILFFSLATALGGILGGFIGEKLAKRSSRNI
jgi:hypothetical protein